MAEWKEVGNGCLHSQCGSWHNRHAGAGPGDALREAMEVRKVQTAYLGEQGRRAARGQRGGDWGLFREGMRAQRRPGTDGTSRLQFHGNTQHPIFGYKSFRKASLFCLSSHHSWPGQGQTIALSRGLWGVNRDGVGDPWVMSGGAVIPKNMI